MLRFAGALRSHQPVAGRSGWRSDSDKPLAEAHQPGSWITSSASAAVSERTCRRSHRIFS